MEIDTHPLSGLPIAVDVDAARLRFSAGVSAPAPDRRTAGELRAMLRDPGAAAEALADDVVYTLYPGLATDETGEEMGRRGLRYVALVVRAGTVGAEWVRTRGHTNSHAAGTPVPFPEVHEVWHGLALLYLQTAVAPEVDDVVAVPLGPGDKAVVPPGWASLLVNIGASPLAVGTWRPADCVTRHEELEALGGMAHYVLAGGEPGAYAFEPNTRYRTVPVPRIVPARDLPEFGLHRDEPMFTTFRRNPDFFRFLTRPQDHDAQWTSLYP
uniref:glucose-6-phosphate isomerase n=1 Tax=uncultured Armatimonadetes bacterium TaxID=157466 RepID=A0A6J4HHI5_9BACT|nr:hypothetical protein AVDCRST_MAG63-654 [uncultured Armatimonadetes bacterium]